MAAHLRGAQDQIGAAAYDHYGDADAEQSPHAGENIFLFDRSATRRKSKHPETANKQPDTESQCDEFEPFRNYVKKESHLIEKV